MRSVYKGIAHPWLCDAMGHLTTRNYMAMFDDSTYHLIYEVVGYAGSTGRFEGLGFADVKHTIEYRAEVAAGELIEIHGEFVRCGGKSFTQRYRMTNLASGDVAATMEGITAFFDLRARRAVKIPDDIRAAIEGSIEN